MPFIKLELFECLKNISLNFVFAFWFLLGIRIGSTQSLIQPRLQESPLLLLLLLLINFWQAQVMVNCDIGDGSAHKALRVRQNRIAFSLR